MEMEDHHHHHHHHNNHHHQQQQQQQQYGITDLRQLVNGVAAARSTHHFHASSIPPAAHPTAELFPGHPNLTAPTQQQHYEMMMFGRQVADIMPPRCLHEFASTDAAAATTTNTSIAVATTPTTTTSASTPPLSGLGGAEGAGCLGGDASTGRWPRQETLTLLEIRSRLDLKFKEANQKGPLWDEVSRIMCEEHGYQRSGKKCREKFENLYKYYKKTKEGKAGRQDGKHYRFFRQLEALYGENSSNTASAPDTTSIRYHQTNPTNQDMLLIHHHKQQHCDSLSLTNSTDFDTSSSDDNDDDHVNHSNNDDDNQQGGGGLNNNESVENKIMRRKQRGGSGRSWKVKIKDFIDLQMRKLVEKQEEWLDKLMKTLEQKEKERALREEEWRRQEAARLEKEHKFWAKERSWIEARDAALMDALQKLTGGSDHQVKVMMMNNESPDEGLIAAAAGIQSQNNNNEDGSSEILQNSTARGGESWPEPEIARLLQLRAEMVETRSFRQGGGCSEEAMWEEVASKMACFGYERSALMLKDKWESISSYHHQNPRSSNNNNNNNNNNVIGAHKEGNKKRKENNSRSCFYFDGNEQLQPSLYNQGSGGGGHGGGGFCDINDQRQQQHTNDGSSPSNSNAADTCFPFLMTEGGTLWDNYSLKLNKANQNQ